MSPVRARPRPHPLLLAVALVLLAPLVGEFLLGNIPVSQLGMALFLAPLYGGGALLVREVARHLGRGWPTIALFAAAYAVLEEGPVDQMVFNPGYLGLDSFAGYGEIPGLGISASLVVYSLALHTVWSICVPIALVEAFDPTPTRPWLGRRGVIGVATCFVGGCIALGLVQVDELDFVGTPAQFAVTGALIVALVAAGLLAGRRSTDHDEAQTQQPDQQPDQPARTAPRPLRVGLAAFVVTSTYWFFSAPDLPGEWSAVGGVVWLFLVTRISVGLVRGWSLRPGWDGRHRVALAGGACATYATWFGPLQALEAGTGPVEIAVSAAVFGLAAAVLVAVAARRQRALTSTPTPELTEPRPA